MAKKVKYFYNSHTLKYERLILSKKKIILQVLGYLATAGVFAVIIVSIAYRVMDSPKEKRLKRDIEQLTAQYKMMARRMQQMDVVMTDLKDRDNNIYRAVFEADPIKSSEWETEFSRSDRYKALESSNYGSLMVNTERKLNNLGKKMLAQAESYAYLMKLVKTKDKMLLSLPAIQPVSNKDLTRMASGYGYRIHPIYKTQKMHEGMDFTAPTGTSIYATGDGTVIAAGNERGFGNRVEIDHGYGYKTVYAHMSKLATRTNKVVKRGEVIGYVGSTGLSTGAHLHYEVHKNGTSVNPINYYYNDLSPAEYAKMVELSSRNNQSFD